MSPAPRLSVPPEIDRRALLRRRRAEHDGFDLGELDGDLVTVQRFALKNVFPPCHAVSSSPYWRGMKE
jgi:hypothetical protein